MSVRHAAVFVTGFLLLPCLAAQTPGPELHDAIAALQRSDFASAERELRSDLARRPDDPWALSLLGAALDSQKKIADAEGFHRRAVARAPQSAEILNNYATHLWMAGRPQEAAQIYGRIVAIEPSHYNANLQLARVAIESRNAAEALHCLDRLPAERQPAPQVEYLRLQALALAGNTAEADAMAVRLQPLARADAAFALAAASVLTSAGRADAAAQVLEAGLQGAPARFDLLYDLGVASTRAGYYERAREVLTAALGQQPKNANVLYALGVADYQSRRFEDAVRALSQAVQADPRHADALKLLAAATSDVGALDDAAALWDRYLKLKPGDDSARRERGYTAVQRGRFQEGIADLEWYLARHPGDAAGHYELGQAERSRNPAKAMEQYGRALEIDPHYVPALAARGSLYYQLAQPEAAARDLELAASLRPDDAETLDRLGQTYQALDRTADAVRALRRAAELAPDDSKILLHCARALADSGDTRESKALMERFRQLGPEKKIGVPAGFVDYLSLSDAQRHAAYRANLERAMREHPEAVDVKVEYLKLLIRDGRESEAVAQARAIAAAHPGGAVLAEMGRALSAGGDFTAACEFLEQAKSAGAPAGTETDLAVAVHFSRAEAGNPAATLGEFEQAIGAAPGRPDLYRQAALFLEQKGRSGDAREVLDRGAKALPDDRGILLLAAIAAELAGDRPAAQSGLDAMQNRWPEWHAAWAARGMILAKHGDFAEARRALETAIALGAGGAEVYAALARASLGAGDRAAADAAQAQARRLGLHEDTQAGPPDLLSFFR
jgi:Flp pilus assembly protein TadD